MSGPVVEVVVFRLNEGVGTEQFERAAAASASFIEALPGFQGRELLRPGPVREGGEAGAAWVDIVHWASLEVAESAGAAVMESASCAEMMSAIDEESVQMLHLHTSAVSSATAA